jgi:hypothetical protein
MVPGAQVSAERTPSVRARLPGGKRAREYTRYHLERLGIADQVPEFRWGSKRVRL